MNETLKKILAILEKWDNEGVPVTHLSGEAIKFDFDGTVLQRIDSGIQDLLVEVKGRA